MSAIVNYRDLLLQAASPRVLPVPVEAASVTIEASATNVIGPATGVTTPANITLTAKLSGGLAGTVTWSIVNGTGTLVPSGNTCSVSGSSMAVGNLTVKATLVAGTKTFTAQINLTKTKDTTALENEVNNLLNNTKDLVLTASALNFTGNSPSSITLTAVKKNGLTGVVSWSVYGGYASLSPSGDVCYVSASSVAAGSSVTVRARITSGSKDYDAYATLTKLGVLSGADKVDLTTQVVGQLNNGNVSGLGALALLNVVNLNTQTVGALNGATQVTNLGVLAYANAIAANQIGVGTLAAGVIYSGTINTSQLNTGVLAGHQIRTNISQTGPGFHMDNISSVPTFRLLGYDGSNSVVITPGTVSLNSGTKLSMSPSSKFDWGTQTYNSPTGSGLKYMRDDGQWIDPFGITTSTAGAHAGFIVLPDGKRIPYQNPS